MKYAVEMGSGDTIYIYIYIYIYTKLHKHLLRTQNLIGEINRYTDSMVIAYTYFYFFKIKKTG
jgi:hypothetical protein